MGTGHHAAVIARVGPGKTAAVVGDGAVGLCAVIAARRLGAEQIIVLGRHPDRIALAREFGAANVVSERSAEAVERVRELTAGFGVHSVLECVGTEQSMHTAISIARPGGAVGRVGVPQQQTIPGSEPAFYNNVMVGGGPAPGRAYIEDLLPDVLEGKINPGRVFDRTAGLDQVHDVVGAMYVYDPAVAAAQKSWGDLPDTATLDMVNLATELAAPAWLAFRNPSSAKRKCRRIRNTLILGLVYPSKTTRLDGDLGC